MLFDDRIVGMTCVGGRELVGAVSVSEVVY